MKIPKQVLVWFEDHAGLITRQRALELGMSVQQIDYLIARGTWLVVHPTVYRIAGAPIDDRQRLLAACLAVPGLAAASHRAAANNWDTGLGLGGHIEISTVRKFSARLRGVTVHWSTDLARHHCVVRNGLLVTNPPRTALDLGAVCSQQIVARFIDWAAARQLAGYGSMNSMLKELGRRGRWGSGVLRSVLEERGIDPPGHLSAAVNRMFREYGVEGLEPEYEVRTASGLFLGRVDYADPPIKLALEFDDWESHSLPADVAYDHERQERIEDEGWTFRRFTTLDVRNRPWNVVNRIEAIRRSLLAAPLPTEVVRPTGT